MLDTEQRLVVDLWWAHLDLARGHPTDETTLFTVHDVLRRGQQYASELAPLHHENPDEALQRLKKRLPSPPEASLSSSQ